jgi:hypothetical protein
LNKLQNIDDLLKKSAADFGTADVGEHDWLSIEKKLGRRKNRIYAMWFFLALILVSSSIALITNLNSTNIPTVVENKEEQTNKQPLETITDQPIQDNTILQEDGLNESSGGNARAIDRASNPTPVHNSTHTPYTEPTQPTPEVEQPISPKEVTNPIVIDQPILEDEVVEVVIEDIVSEVEEENKENIVIDEPKKEEQKANRPNSSNGGNTNNAKIGYWETGFSFTPGLSNKVTSENSTFAGLINRSYYNEVVSGENAAFANSAGLNAQYHLPNGFFVATGLFITQRKEQINYNYTITEWPNGVNDYEIQDYSPLAPVAYVDINHSGSNSYHFIEIPVNMGYKRALKRNFEIRGQLGLSYLNLFKATGTKADYTFLELKDVNDFNFDNHNLAASTKVGIYLNKKRFVIGAEPTFSLNLNSMSATNAAIKLKPYNYGFNISTNYKLMKK